MGKKKAAASTPAVAALNSAGISHTTHPYEHDPRSDLGYGLEAAQAIGVPPEQVFKTLMVSVDGTLTVAIIPVNCTLDLKAVAHTVHGKKATMAPVDAAQRATGYVVGGISPLAKKLNTPRSLTPAPSTTTQCTCPVGGAALMSGYALRT